MNNDFKKMDEALCGLRKVNFGGLDLDRKECEYTWNDMEFNMNSFPFQTDTAIIVTSYAGQLGWLKATLTNYRKSGALVILAYDNTSYIWNNIEDVDYYQHMFPRPIHYLLAHATVIKHKTYDADKRTGWFWDVKYAQSIINGFPNIKYVYCTNGDCIIEKPEGIKELPAILGDGDFISGQSTPGSTIHTANIFYKIDSFNKIMDYMSNRMKHSVMASQSPEGLLRDAVDELKLKETFAEQPLDKHGNIDYYGKEDADCTWKRVLGFKNLYHSLEYRENNGLEPLDAKYFDPYKDWMYFRGEWRQSLCKYFETKDRRYLMQWWDMGKDSDYERKYLPLEAYGKDPIYE
jgi:hypothetical protein